MGRAHRTWLLLLLLLFCANCSRDGNAPIAHHGKITIDAPHTGEIVALNGEWAFYWNRLLTPEDFAAPNPLKPDGYLEEPGTWSEFRHAGKPVGPYGVVTLRLIVDPGPGRRDLGLALPTIARAYRLWLDGRLVSTRGMVGTDASKEGGAPSTRIVRFQSSGKPFALVLQISNHHSAAPGIQAPVVIGPQQLIEQWQLAPIRRTLFIAGGLAMIAFSCLAVFAFRRTDYPQLYFGFFVLLWTLLILIQYDRGLWLDLILGKDAEPYLLRAEYALLYLSLPFGYGFFQSLYPRDLPLSVVRVTYALAIPFTIAAAIVPYLQLRALSQLAYALTGVLIVFLAYKVIRAVLRLREGAGFVIASFAVLAGAGLHDIASETSAIHSGYFVMPFGILAFALLQALHMSYRSVRTLRKVEALSSELDAKNAALSLKIIETERLGRQIVRVSEEERSQVSQDLHDGICQQLTAARLRFSVLRKKLLQAEPDKEEIDELSRLLESAVNQAYDMSLGLWPVETGTGQLATSFEELCRRTGRSGNLAVEFHSNLPACPGQPSEAPRQLYRIAQEALTNVAKHAKARHVNVSVSCSPDCGMQLTVEDDGQGRPGTAAPTSGGLGTRIMQHRAAMIGGTLTIEDRSNGGTVVSCTVPCPRPRNPDCPFMIEQHHD